MVSCGALVPRPRSSPGLGCSGLGRGVLSVLICDRAITDEVLINLRSISDQSHLFSDRLLPDSESRAPEGVAKVHGLVPRGQMPQVELQSLLGSQQWLAQLFLYGMFITGLGLSSSVQPLQGSRKATKVQSKCNQSATKLRSNAIKLRSN